MNDDASAVIRRNDASGRYELVIGSEVVSFAEFDDRSAGRAFVHTVTEPAFRGHGHADRLIRAALDDTRRDGLLVVPECPFVRTLIRDNPEYQDLVAPRR